METAPPGLDEPPAGPVLRPYSPCPRRSAPHPGGEVLTRRRAEGAAKGTTTPSRPSTEVATSIRAPPSSVSAATIGCFPSRLTSPGSAGRAPSPGRQKPQARSGTGPEASWDRAADRLSVKPVKIGANPDSSRERTERGVQMRMRDAATCMNGRPPTARAVGRPVPPPATTRTHVRSVVARPLPLRGGAVAVSARWCGSGVLAAPRPRHPGAARGSPRRHRRSRRRTNRHPGG